MLFDFVAKRLKEAGRASVIIAAGTAVSLAWNATPAQAQSHDDDAPVVMSIGSDTIESSSDLAPVGFLGLIGDEPSCDAGCEPCVTCCAPWWAHRTGAFGEFLLLRPGSTDQIYEVEYDDPTPLFPTGGVGRLNIDEETGFRVGFSCCASECTSLVGSYTFFESNTSDSITADPGRVLVSQLIHPDLGTTGGAGLGSSADYSIDFQLVDLAYRHIWRANDTYAINWLAGFRYGHLDQSLLSVQERAVATGNVTVDTDVDFDGFGMLLGFDATRRSCRSGLLIYSRGLSTFLAGDWRGDYAASNQLGGGVVRNDYDDYRITPVVELELGFGWQSKCGRCKATVGYLTSAWYDAVSTREYINAVRANNLTSVEETITFNGLTAGVEARF